MVTILILVDGFLQLEFKKWLKKTQVCHNPYFNRWFSAITILEKGEEACRMSQSLF